MAKRRQGLPEEDVAQIGSLVTATINTAMEPFITDLRELRQEVYGTKEKGGSPGIVSMVRSHEMHKTRMTGYVIAGGILLPVLASILTVWLSTLFK